MKSQKALMMISHSFTLDIILERYLEYQTSKWVLEPLQSKEFIFFLNESHLIKVNDPIFLLS